MGKIRIEDIKPGMVFEKTVYIDSGTIFVPPMVPVKKEDIDRLRKWGIEELETEGEEIKSIGHVTKDMGDEVKDRIAIEKEETQRIDYGSLFSRGVKLLEELFDHVKSGTVFDKKLLLEFANEIISSTKQDKERGIHEVSKDHEGKYLYILGVGVAILSAITGLTLGYGDDRLTDLVSGALIHDIGMVRVPIYITEKKGKLTPDEYNRIKTHTIYGYRIAMRELGFDSRVANIPLQHHEAFDGSGYPRGLKGNAILQEAKIVNICDVYMALIKKRSYREEHLSYQAMKIILSGANRKFDPLIVKAFLSNMAIYPVGSLVQLSNNTIGRVTKANPALPLRPQIQVLVDEFGNFIKDEKIIDLEKEKNLYIIKPLPKDYLDRK